MQGRIGFQSRVKMALSLGPFSNSQMRFPNRNERTRHTQPLISRPRLRETELDTQDRAETDALRENLHRQNERKSLLDKGKLKLLIQA
jgi:hypothetical protein